MPSSTCKICGREFSHFSSLRNHIKTHDDVVDRVLREISEEGVNVHEQLVKLNDNESINMELSDSKQQLEEEEVEEIKEEEEIEKIEEEEEVEVKEIEKEEEIEEEVEEEKEVKEEEIRRRSIC